MLKINTKRTFISDIKLSLDTDSGPKEGSFKAEYRILPFDKIKQKNLLDQVLVAVNGITLYGKNNKPIADTLSAIKKDPQLSLALIETYNRDLIKKSQPLT